jgi:hypothetical protein
MSHVQLLKAGDAWNVVADGHLSSCADLELAALKAVELAELHGWPIDLGNEVPVDALHRARRRHQREAATPERGA